MYFTETQMIIERFLNIVIIGFQHIVEKTPQTSNSYTLRGILSQCNHTNASTFIRLLYATASAIICNVSLILRSGLSYK